MRGWRRLGRVRGDRGAQAVEFALVSVPLLTILYGLIAFGFAINQEITATQLAREAARSAAICAGASGATSESCQTAGQTRFDANRPAGFSGTLSWDIGACFPAPSTGDAKVTVTTTPILAIPFLTQIEGVSTTPCGG
jgi:Flp pilus assembly protein TadG